MGARTPEKGALMGGTLRRVAAACAATFLLIASGGSASAVTDDERAAKAVGYIASQQLGNGSIPAFSPLGSTADAVLAFVAAGEGRGAQRRALDYIAASIAETQGEVDLGLQAKVVLAWTASGRDPRSVGGINLVRRIRDGLDGTYPGNFDAALAILALVAAEAPIHGATLERLASEECPDGGWAFDRYREASEDAHCISIAEPETDFFGSDTNTTAYAVMALAASPVPTRTIPAPFAFFDAIRDPMHGGWGYTWGFQTTDANSTGLVLQAYAAEGTAPPSGSQMALRQLQYPGCGAFAFSWDAEVRGAPDLGATIGAVPGLLGMAFPYAAEVSGPALDTPGCAA
jgi:hypothetical protein